MTSESTIATIRERYIVPDNAAQSDYFAALKELVEHRESADNEAGKEPWQIAIDQVYDLVLAEILTNEGMPVEELKFGTSGWRGVLGKDIFVKSVATVTCAILDLDTEGANNPEMKEALGELYAEHGAVNFQLGRFYPFRDRLSPEALALLDAVKGHLDPHCRLSPGVLGFEPGRDS